MACFHIHYYGTSNRIYNLKDIKITSVGANRIFSPAVDINNNDKDTSTDVIKINIPQLYNIIKKYDQKFVDAICKGNYRFNYRIFIIS